MQSPSLALATVDEYVPAAQAMQSLDAVLATVVE
jgi:hypothetical protein